MKRWWIVAITAFLALSMVIGVSVALAGGGPKTDAAQSQQTKEVAQEQDAQEPSYQSSTTVPEPEPQDLNSLAKITADQAKEAALAANPGSIVTQVELDNENGNLVWSVEFTNGIEIKVDAGNGMVVHTENDANEASESNAEETE
jgi:uncharacterized membrane protein YkoI